jgi:hypothetical protein|tara:strand:+ start:125177 stop:125812 length:636 start_codon:yes stop_codon:yes gene_type:complete
MESKSAKYGLIGAIVAALIAGGVTLFIHFDKSPDGSRLVESVISEEKEQKREPRIIVNIIDTFITPVAFEGPAYFYTEIRVVGEKPVEAMLVSLDFGKASATNCEVKPESILAANKANNGLLRLSVNQLNKHESIYIACNLTLPTFNQILVTGGNLTSESKLTYNTYSREPEGEDTPVFLVFMFIFVGLPFCVYLMVVVIRLINRWLKLSW